MQSLISATSALRLLNLVLLVTCSVMATGAGAASDPLKPERERFLEARSALNSGKITRFRELAAELESYPLYPYLEYATIQRFWSKQTDADIQRFLDRNSDTLLAARLRRQWLKNLGRKRQWSRFLAFYQSPQAVKLECYKLQAEYAKPPTATWLDQAQALWLVGHSQPDACNPVFKVLKESPRMTRELVWTRISLAFQKRKLSLASYLGRQLPEQDRKLVALWRKAHVRPAETLSSRSLKKDIPITRNIVAHAVNQLARKDPAEAHKRWLAVRDRYDFNVNDRAAIERNIALYAGYRGLPDAYTWFAGLPDSAMDPKAREWRARSALRTSNWEGLLDSVNVLEPEQKQSSEWRYWRAYSLEQLGQEAVAIAFYTELAGKRDYYGFLAADRINWTYSLNHDAIESDDTVLQVLQNEHAGLVRARELYLAGLKLDARREWRQLTMELAPRELELAAVLAHQWGWHDRAIITAARSGHLDDLDLRFPVLYEEEVEEMAKTFKLDPAWILGVMRQESAFMQDARSPAGALGLMQLMPATSRSTARLLALPAPSRSALIQPDPNIRLGSGYLRHVLDRFDGNQVLATAAYNAGPHRVDRWLPDDAAMPATQWIDTIPFSETRGYIRAVLAFTTVYESKINPPVTRLSERMLTVGGAVAVQ